MYKFPKSIVQNWSIVFEKMAPWLKMSLSSCAKTSIYIQKLKTNASKTSTEEIKNRSVINRIYRSVIFVKIVCVCALLCLIFVGVQSIHMQMKPAQRYFT